MTDVKDSMPVLERFVVLMSYHKNRSIMPEMFWLFAHKGRNLENLRAVDHVLFHHTKRVAYKDGQYFWDSAWNGDGQDPSQMHGSLCGPRDCEHQSPIGEVTIKYVCMVYRELVQSRTTL